MKARKVNMRLKLEAGMPPYLESVHSMPCFELSFNDIIMASSQAPSSSHRNSMAASPAATPPTTPTPIPPKMQSVSVAKKTSRGSFFTSPEDEAMTNAWIRVSEESIIESDQKRDVFLKP